MSRILEYLLNEPVGASAGSIVDSSGNGVNLTPNYAGTMSVISGAAGNGLNNTADGGTSAAHASALLNPTVGAGQQLNGLTSFHLIVKFTQGNMAYPDSTLFRIGNATTNSLRFGRTAINTNAFYIGDIEIVFYGQNIIMIVFDSTQADPVDRLRIYGRNENTFFVSGVDGGSVNIPQNTAVVVPTDSEIVLLNDFSRDTTGEGGSWQGTLWHFALDNTVVTQAEAETMLAALDVDDDTSLVTAPGLTWNAVPSFDQITANSGRLILTTNLDADISIVPTAAGSTEPLPATFDSGIQDTSVGGVQYTRSFSGLNPEETTRYWIRATNNGESLITSVDLTTLAVATGTILSINGGNPLRPGMTGIVVLWSEGGNASVSTLINGVEQLNHTIISDNETRFDFVWPNVMYNQTAELSSGGLTATTPTIQPPFGSGYTIPDNTYDPLVSGTITAFPDIEIGLDQLEFEKQNDVISTEQWWNISKVDVPGNLRPIFYNGFDGFFVCRLIDNTDGSRSEPEIIPYSVNSSSSIDGPGTFRRGETLTLNVTTANIVPTLLNTTVTLNGVSLTPTAISGVGPYVITVNIPDSIILKYGTNYDCVVTIGLEILTLNNITFDPPVNSSYVDIDTIETTSGRVFYLGTIAPEINSQLEWSIVSGSGNLSITSAGVWVWNTRPVATVVVRYRYISPTGVPYSPVEHTYVV